jgi:hypothetical protein
MWEVSDKDCVDVAKVCTVPSQMSDEKITDAAVCRGLHPAVRMLRNGQTQRGRGEA